MTPSTPKPPLRESAAVVLVRGSGAALEVFWVRRSEAVAVQPGFRAFLGGKVDAADAELPLTGIAPGVESAVVACAIREALEEAGVLVGCTTAPPAADIARARAQLLAGEATLAAIARQHGWRFDAGALTFAGRWQTPRFASARFDTLYFLARVPEGQQPEVTPGELALGEWTAPLAALDRYRHGEETFVAPILWTLIALAEGEEGLAERLARGPERAFAPVPRIEMQWGVVLHAMHTKPLPPALYTNAYLIGEREMALVDPGSGDASELAALFALTDHLATEGRRVTAIVVTHHHPDHVGGIVDCRKRFACPVVGHPALAEHLAIDVAMRDGEWLPLVPGLSPWNLQVLHVPGHTRDSIALWHPARRALFCGDLVPGGPGSVIIDPPDGDMGAYLASLERCASLGVETIFPAHGSPQGAGVRRIRALIAHRRDRESKVFAALGPAPLSLADLVPAAYADTPKDLWPYAERSLLAHLELLERDGRAVRFGEGWRQR